MKSKLVNFSFNSFKKLLIYLSIFFILHKFKDNTNINTYNRVIFLISLFKTTKFIKININNILILLFKIVNFIQNKVL